VILVVDDERAIREIVAEILVEEGYAVQSVADGLDALAVIDVKQVDLVLSDVKMPNLDGHALVHRLRAAGSAVPVILMSAAVTESAVPGVTLVRKPFDATHLLAMITALLESSAGRIDAVANPGMDEKAAPHG
jgi:two-component system response regulator MprA